MKELPKRGYKVKVGKRVCTVLRKQGNDFIGRDDQGKLIGFDKHTPFTIIARSQGLQEQGQAAAPVVDSEAVTEATEADVQASAEGESGQAADSSSALSSEEEKKASEDKEDDKKSLMDMLFGGKK